MRVSFWLLPAEPQRSEFQSLINRLARQFDAPVFVPHVTLYSTPLAGKDDLAATLSRIAKTTSPLELRALDVSWSDQFTKTLYINLESTDALRQLSLRFKQSVNSSIGYDLNPHLSLVYAHIDASVKADLARTISFPGMIRFNALDAIVSGDRTQSAQDVKSWRHIGEIPFPKD